MRDFIFFLLAAVFKHLKEKPIQKELQQSNACFIFIQVMHGLSSLKMLSSFEKQGYRLYFDNSEDKRKSDY